MPHGFVHFLKIQVSVLKKELKALGGHRVLIR